MRTETEIVEQEKNRNSQKSMMSVRLMGVGVCGGKAFWKSKCTSQQYQSKNLGILTCETVSQSIVYNSISQTVATRVSP